MEFGLAQGLAVDLQYDKRIQDARWQEQQYKRAQAENMAELKAFEDDLDYMNASNAFDHKLIKEDADKTIREIGEIVRNNQDWRYNPEVRRQINEKKKYLKSNQNVIRGMASDAEYKKLLADMGEIAKDPKMYDTEAYNNVMNQWKNYEAFGNQNGREAALKEGFKAFVYQKPAQFDRDLEKKWIELGNNIKDKDLIMLGNGGYRETIKEDKLRQLAIAEVNKNKRQVDVMYSPKSEEEAVTKVADIIRQGIQTAYKAPEVNMGLQTELARQRWEDKKMAMSTDKTLDPYYESVVKMKENYIEPEALTEILGTTPEARVYDADGIFKGTVKNRKFIPNGSFTQANDVRRVAPYKKKDGTISEYALASDKPVGVVHGYVEMSEADLDESGYLNDPALKDKITRKSTINAKGNTETIFSVPVQVHFDPNDEGKRFKFNNYIGATTKQISALNPLQQQQFQNVPRTVVQNGITYRFNEQTGKYE